MQAYQTADVSIGLYDGYEQRSNYNRSEGVIVLPVATQGPVSPRIIQVHAPIGFRTVAFSGTKRGSPPMYPAIANTPTNDIILSSALDFPLPIIGGSQTQYDYQVNGEYTYVQAGPRTEINNPGASASQTQFYGPRDSNSQFQTGRYPFQPVIVNALISANVGYDIGNDDDSNAMTYPFTPVWAWATPGGPEVTDPYNFSPLPSGPSYNASSTIDLSQYLEGYFDTNIGPSFTSPSLIS